MMSNASNATNVGCLSRAVYHTEKNGTSARISLVWTLCVGSPCNFKRMYIGLSRLCSATFEQLLAFGATFCGFSNLEQVLPFRAIFEQNIGLEHISSTKKSTISWKTSIHANFLKAYHVINLLNT